MRIILPLSWLYDAIAQLVRHPADTLTWAFSIRRTVSGPAVLLARRDERTFPEKSSGPLRLRLAEPFPPAEAEFALPTGECGLWLARDGRWQAVWQPQPRAGFRLPRQAGVELTLPGPGLLHLPASTPLPAGVIRRESSREGWKVAAATWHQDTTERSRTAGALGWATVWNLRQQDYALIGAGRTGTVLAELLAAYQPRSLTLIDPDRIEAGNLDGLCGTAQQQRMDATAPTAKVAKLDDWLRQTQPGAITRFRPLAQSVLGRDAQDALAECTVLVSAVDNDAARLSTAVAGSIGHHLHLDVGSGIHRDAHGNPTFGADIRLIVPGENRCLCCLGGFARPADLAALNQPLRTQPTDWQENKAGSLTSFSHLVAGLALRLLEDLAAERLTHSLWLQVLQPPDAAFPTIRPLDAPADPHCPVCALAGQGVFHAPYLSQLAAAVVARQQRQVS